MSSIIDGIVKGVAGLMPQDDPDVKRGDDLCPLGEASI